MINSDRKPSFQHAPACYGLKKTWISALFPPSFELLYNKPVLLYKKPYFLYKNKKNIYFCFGNKGELHFQQALQKNKYNINIINYKKLNV